MTALRPALVAPFILAVILVGCGQSPTGTAVASAVAEAMGAATVQVSDQAGVTVKVTWVGTSAGAVFEVTLDTHAGDLDPLDLADAALRNDRGEQVSDAVWDVRQAGRAFHEKVRSGDGWLSWDEPALPGFGSKCPRLRIRADRPWLHRSVDLTQRTSARAGPRPS